MLDLRRMKRKPLQPTLRMLKSRSSGMHTEGKGVAQDELADCSNKAADAADEKECTGVDQQRL